MSRRKGRPKQDEDDFMLKPLDKPSKQVLSLPLYVQHKLETTDGTKEATLNSNGNTGGSTQTSPQTSVIAKNTPNARAYARSTWAGHQRTVCDTCRRQKRRCTHKDDPANAPPPRPKGRPRKNQVANSSPPKTAAPNASIPAQISLPSTPASYTQNTPGQVQAPAYAHHAPVPVSGPTYAHSAMTGPGQVYSQTQSPIPGSSYQQHTQRPGTGVNYPQNTLTPTAATPYTPNYPNSAPAGTYGQLAPAANATPNQANAPGVLLAPAPPRPAFPVPDPHAAIKEALMQWHKTN